MGMSLVQCLYTNTFIIHDSFSVINALHKYKSIGATYAAFGMYQVKMIRTLDIIICALNRHVCLINIITNIIGTLVDEVRQIGTSRYTQHCTERTIKILERAGLETITLKIRAMTTLTRKGVVHASSSIRCIF